MIPAVFQVFFGLLVMGTVAFPTEHPLAVVPAPEAILAVVWLGLLGSGLAYLSYFRILQHWGATRTSMVAYLLPVWASASAHSSSTSRRREHADRDGPRHRRHRARQLAVRDAAVVQPRSGGPAPNLTGAPVGDQTIAAEPDPAPVRDASSIAAISATVGRPSAPLTAGARPSRIAARRCRGAGARGDGWRCRRRRAPPGPPRPSAPAPPSSPGIVQRSLRGSLGRDMPATNDDPRSVSTPTDAPFAAVDVDRGHGAGPLRVARDDRCASAPLANRTTATAVSSTSISGWLTFAVQPSTSAAGPRNQQARSSWWTAWLTSTPPPSPCQRAPPRIHGVVLGAAPAEHLDGRQAGRADPAVVDRGLHPAERPGTSAAG